MNKTEIDKILEGRSFREMEVRALTADEGGEDSYLVEGYATTFNQPYVLWQEEGWTLLEQVDRAAFDNTDMTDVIMQYDHCGRVFARKSNGTLALTIDDHGLKVRADLSGTDIGRQLYQEIKGGYTTKMSFGFIIDEGGDRRETTEEDGKVTIVRTITNIRKLFDVSAVSLPANDATAISARNEGEGVIALIREELAETAKVRAQKQEIINRINGMKEV